VNEQLWKLYQNGVPGRGAPLDEFIERLRRKEWGRTPRRTSWSCSRDRGQMLANIQVKALEGSRFAEMADEVSERTQREFELSRRRGSAGEEPATVITPLRSPSRSLISARDQQFELPLRRSLTSSANLGEPGTLQGLHLDVGQHLPLDLAEQLQDVLLGVRPHSFASSAR